jgi:hypothetical protein
MVNAIKRLHLTGDGIQTADQFEQRIVDAIHQAKMRRTDGHREGGVS